VTPAAHRADHRRGDVVVKEPIVGAGQVRFVCPRTGEPVVLACWAVPRVNDFVTLPDAARPARVADVCHQWEWDDDGDRVQVVTVVFDRAAGPAEDTGRIDYFAPDKGEPAGGTAWR
jgi:hypothetical protein